MSITTIQDEKALLQRVAEGDETAFATLFHAYHQGLGIHIFSIIKSRELTEEIVQDVFLKIWMNRETLSEVRNFKDYLFIVSRNQALTALRKLVTLQKREQEWEAMTRRQLDTSNETNDFRETGLSLIDQGIAQLPPQQQKCYLLSRRDKLTYQEIAAELGIGRETVKTNISLAVASVSKFVQAEMDKILLLLWVFLCYN